MASSNLISKLCLNDEAFKFSIPELENRIDKLEATIADNQEIYTEQHGWQSMAAAMQSVAKAAEQAMHGVYEAMSRIYCLEDQLSGSSASAESENPNENLLGEFWFEIDKTNMFLQNLK